MLNKTVFLSFQRRNIPVKPLDEVKVSYADTQCGLVGFGFFLLEEMSRHLK